MVETIMKTSTKKLKQKMKNTKSNLKLGKRKLVAECKEMKRIEQRIREMTKRVNK